MAPTCPSGWPTATLRYERSGSAAASCVRDGPRPASPSLRRARTRLDRAWHATDPSTRAHGAPELGRGGCPASDPVVRCQRECATLIRRDTGTRRSSTGETRSSWPAPSRSCRTRSPPMPRCSSPFRGRARAHCARRWGTTANGSRSPRWSSSAATPAASSGPGATSSASTGAATCRRWASESRSGPSARRPSSSSASGTRRCSTSRSRPTCRGRCCAPTTRPGWRPRCSRPRGATTRTSSRAAPPPAARATCARSRVPSRCPSPRPRRPSCTSRRASSGWSGSSSHCGRRRRASTARGWPTSCSPSTSWPPTACATRAARAACAPGARTGRCSPRSATAVTSRTRWRAATSPARTSSTAAGCTWSTSSATSCSCGRRRTAASSGCTCASTPTEFAFPGQTGGMPAAGLVLAQGLSDSLGGSPQPDLLEARQMQALSLAVHIPIVCFGIAFPAMFLFVEGLYLRTGDETYKRLAMKWSKVGLTLFAVGVVTGTILSFEFGLLWPEFMASFGQVFGIAFALEGISFFVEAIFIAIYVYGWDRLSPRAHFLSGVPIVISGFAGSFNVLAVNGWMNDPGGFDVVAGKVADPRPWEAMFNDAMAHEVFHMYLAGYVVAGFIVAGVYSVAWLRGRRDTYVHTALVVALSFACLAAPVQVIVGDWAARSVTERQPVKLAAFEGLAHTTKGASFTIGGVFDEDEQRVRSRIENTHL